MRSRRWHRRTFVAAAAYNVTWGLATALYPAWLLPIAGGDAGDRLGFVSALGLVVGLYGVMYAEVARQPERGWLIAAVGLTGKVLGPIGLIVLVLQGSWPPRSLLICLTNDFVWWIPFAWYLRDAWPYFARDLRGDESAATRASVRSARAGR